jgi:hypothetical protein
MNRRGAGYFKNKDKIVILPKKKKIGQFCPSSVWDSSLMNF